MRDISQKKLNKILKKHELWLKGEGGEQANLRYANLGNAILSYADLRHVDLSYSNLLRADLRGANLSCTDLRRANLRRANLEYTDLRHADLRGANLSCTDLTHADLGNAKSTYTNLEDANLVCADLEHADLTNANLKYVNLRRANLTYTNLSDTNLVCADLRYANLKDIKTNINTTGYKLACPEKGSFIGYKKAGGCIIELLILEDAKRSSATSSKCRTNKVKVLDIENIKTRNKVKEINSDYDNNFIYRVGEIVYVDNFNEYRWEECTSGIHFFMNKEDAINY